jgi:hypothetical protein
VAKRELRIGSRNRGLAGVVEEREVLQIHQEVVGVGEEAHRKSLPCEGVVGRLIEVEAVAGERLIEAEAVVGERSIEVEGVEEGHLIEVKVEVEKWARFPLLAEGEQDVKRRVVVEGRVKLVLMAFSGAMEGVGFHLLVE